MDTYEFRAPSGCPEVTVRHTIYADVKDVYKAVTDPKKIPLWWGPERMKTRVARQEARRGGQWRYIQRDTIDGKEYKFHGVFHEVIPARELVFTSEYEGRPGHVSMDTMILEPREGRTELTEKVLFQSVEDRDGMLKTGMEAGIKESFERLDKLLQEK
jgi:uncharacterized protein YndB with AHSA1/START domain